MVVSPPQIWTIISATVLFFLLASISAQATDEAIFVESHNKARAELGLPPLKWDKKLAGFAESYAKKRRGDCALENSGEKRYGENISWGGDRGWGAREAVKAWADEKKFYDPKSNACVGGGECGHYTQMVWRSTAKLGCARVVCDNEDGVFITCDYFPPGNVNGFRPY